MHFPQYNTVRQWLPVANFVLYWGDRGLDAVQSFEKAEKGGVKIHTFHKLQAVVDPYFLEDVMTAMKAPRPSVGIVSAALMKCAKKQWYTWQVMSPDQPVHPERSMTCGPRL